MNATTPAAPLPEYHAAEVKPFFPIHIEVGARGRFAEEDGRLWFRVEQLDGDAAHIVGGHVDTPPELVGEIPRTWVCLEIKRAAAGYRVALLDRFDLTYVVTGLDIAKLQVGQPIKLGAYCLECLRVERGNPWFRVHLHVVGTINHGA